MGWFERAKKASAGQRVTRSDNQHAIDAVAELNALNADRERLMREGLRGIATIVAIHENVTTTLLGSWHELELDVQLPDRDGYRTTRRISLELSTAPHIKAGGGVPVRVDPGDLSKVLVVATL
jgi:CheY-like chemotaxis protein